MKDLLPKYFDSEWSPAHARIPETRSLVTFLASTTQTSSSSLVADYSKAFVVLSHEGTFYRFVYDPQRGGPCVSDVQTKFLHLPVAELSD